MKKNSLPRILAALLAIISFTYSLEAQERVVSGIVEDASSSLPLAGVSIRSFSGNNGATISSSDGTFSLPVKHNSSSLVLSLLGYESITVDISEHDNVGTVKMQPENLMLKDALVVGQIALPRKTPIAVSSVSSSILNENLGNQELVEIL